ncbi:MAG: endonuclease/exonuclease/phosphatase family protein [Bacteroidota bacterium]
MSAKPSKSIFSRILRLVLVLILVPLLYVVGMILYAMATDYQPAATEKLPIAFSGSRDSLPDTLQLLSWNIGYAGQGAESDFFYDGGKQVRASAQTVENNLQGIQDFLSKNGPAADFVLLQEVDTAARRSYHTNQINALQSALPGYAEAFARNYEVQFIPIPFLEPMGKVTAGQSSCSRYQPIEATRYAFEGNYDWPTYLFFLDRCFLLMRFPLASGKELIVINTHNSAYDSDGSLKKRQMEQLSAVLLAEYEKGNAVIVGGDWNQAPPDFNGFPGFELGQEQGFRVEKNYPAAGWQWAVDPSVATNRSLATAWDADKSPRYLIDFFLLSPNLELLEVKGIDLDFVHSDHQPVAVKVVVN